jgi:hypothetical protein
MFRRLAEAFQDSNIGNGHGQFISDQNKYFNTLPNMVLSGNSGLKGFDVAIQSVNTMGNNYQSPPIKNPNSVFMTDPNPALAKLAKQCASSSIDELIAIKNPNAAIGCGWLYTPPTQGSPHPVLSQGFVGDTNGPIQTLEPPEYKKYFFDLQLAKKQMLIDKCKALKACTDVDSDVFNGVCGYCTDTNQGVPIDNVGQPLYGGDSLGACNTQSIVTKGANCPPPPGTGPGPQPVIDKTCIPVNGRLSAACLYNQVLSAGCSDKGSLALALSGNPSPDDYIASLRNADSVKIYNRIANPPLNLDVFSKGATTTAAVLTEARQLAGNSKQAANTPIGAAARDLCLQKGAISNYDFCNDLPDGTQPPFELNCLQQIFRKVGGQPSGASYPTTNTLQTYNSMGTLGAVKQYWNSLIQNMKSQDYNTQRNALIQILGITPELLVPRIPYNQGIEVFWLIPIPGQPNKIVGFLRRTIESDFIQFGGGISPNNVGFPQVGIQDYSATLQLTDIRAPSDFSTKFSVTVDDGFYIAVNQPANIDSTALSELTPDRAGLFGNLGIQAPTTYQSNACTNYYSDSPNITKIYYNDNGGGGHQFNLNIIPCSGNASFLPQYYSLTCEPRAPFLNYEVSVNDGMFEEMRMPGIFSQFLGLNGLEYHMRSEEMKSVPGNKAFVRINSANSCINMPNIAYQSWGTVTFAIRFQTMPVKETIINFSTNGYYYNLITTPLNGSNASVYVEHNFGGSTTSITTPYTFSLNKWYLIYIINKGTGFDLYCSGIDELIQNKGKSTVTSVNANGQLYKPNGTYNPPPGQTQSACNIMVGTNGFMNWRGMYSTSSFNYDLAWIHFFDHSASNDDIYREAQANWVFTQFPTAPNSYNTLSK